MWSVLNVVLQISIMYRWVCWGTVKGYSFTLNAHILAHLCIECEMILRCNTVQVMQQTLPCLKRLIKGWLKMQSWHGQWKALLQSTMEPLGIGQRPHLKSGVLGDSELWWCPSFVLLPVCLSSLGLQKWWQECVNRIASSTCLALSFWVWRPSRPWGEETSKQPMETVKRKSYRYYR